MPATEGQGVSTVHPSPQRILFVDDEINILEGLRNMLRKQRREWEMAFAVGGEAALAELEKQPFDVIVSDMRMPGMDGAALLAKVKELHPSVARIVLSGHAERDAIVRAFPVAHQFLSKPCDGAVLRVVIERVCRLQRTLQDESIRRAVGRLDTLPSAPRSYMQLTQALMDPDVSLGDIAQIVEGDPAMSAKVLQLVNSAYFGLPRRVTSIFQAVMYLGAETIKGLVLTSQVFSLMAVDSIEGFSVERLQEHSLLTARLAKRLVSDPRVAEEAFTAALLRDIGQIIMAVSLRDRFAAIVKTAAEDRRPLQDVEHEVLGVSHAEVGAYLLGVWGLPFPVVEAVAYHHQPSAVTAGDREVLAAVHIADVLVEAGASEDSTGPTPQGLDIGFLETSGWANAVPRSREIVAAEWLAIEQGLADRRNAGADR